MKRLIQIVLFLTIFNFSCQNKPVYIPAILVQNITKHHFSSTSTLDTFSLIATGKNLIDAQVRFTISNSAGRVLYEEHFPANDLLGLNELETPSNSSGNFIKKRIENFFAESNFSSPAIEASQQFDSDYSTKSTWLDIKTDQRSVGFTYLLDYEYSRTIAYSKKLKKVVVFFSCC